MRQIRGKKTLITGAASGIGRSLAVRLAREGADLFLLDVNESGLSSTVNEAKRHGVQVLARPCDLSEHGEITQALAEVQDRWGGLDILINNAGVCFHGKTIEMSEQQWNRLISVNLLAPVQFTRELLPTMLSRPEAHILNVCSMFSFVATNRCSAYHLTKYGMFGFSHALRAEYGRVGLGVTALCPGFVSTNLFTSMENEYRKDRVLVLPRLVTTTPDHVATKAVRAIYRNQRVALVTPLAYLAYFQSRFLPGLLDSLYHLGRRRKGTKHHVAEPSPPSLQMATEDYDVDQRRKAA